MSKLYNLFDAGVIRDRIIEDINGLVGIVEFWENAAKQGHGDPPCDDCDRVEELDNEIAYLEGENRVIKFMLKMEMAKNRKEEQEDDESEPIEEREELTPHPKAKDIKISEALGKVIGKPAEGK